MPKPHLTPRTLAPALALAALALAPAAAQADRSLEVGLGDDRALSLQDAPQTADAWKAAGVQNVRVLAIWQRAAPRPTSTKPPEGFDGADPDAAGYDWGQLDRSVQLLTERGIGVTITVTGPGPTWGSQEPARRNPRWKPDPEGFGDFSEAVAKRYGDRVGRYIVWNEPNLPLWLQPQARRSGRSWKAESPHLYRELARSSYAAIKAVDPSSEVLVGALAPQGARLRARNTQARPLQFLRDMGCVSSSYRKLSTGSCKGFKPVSGDGLAYHPHSSRLSPGARQRDTANASMGDLSRVTTVVDRLTRAKRLTVRGASKMPLHLTEYGYQTNPPDDLLGVSLRAQADWLQYGWNIAYRDSRVRSVYQYEWFDEPKGDSADDGGVGYPGWQSGLYDLKGKRKPSLTAFRSPLFAHYTAKAGTLWGQARELADGATVRVERRRGSGAYRAYKTVTPSSSANGNWTLRIPRGSAYSYRASYAATDGTRTTRTAKPRRLR